MLQDILEPFSSPIQQAVSVLPSDIFRCADVFVTRNADKWTFLCALCQKDCSDIGVLICHIKLEHLSNQSSVTQLSSQLNDTERHVSSAINTTLQINSNLTQPVANTIQLADVSQPQEQMTISCQQTTPSYINAEKEENSHEHISKILDISSFNKTDSNVSGNLHSNETMKRSNSNDFNIFLNDEEPRTNAIRCKRDKLDVIIEKLSYMETQVENNKNLLSRLTQEIIITKNGMQQLLTQFETKNLHILPKEPFGDVENLLKFDSETKEPSKYAILTNDFRRITATSHRDYVFKCWRALMNDSVAKHMCWTGTKAKKSVQELSCTAAIKDAFVKKYPNESVDVFAEKSKKFFLYANDRVIKCEKNKARVN